MAIEEASKAKKINEYTFTGESPTNSNKELDPNI